MRPSARPPPERAIRPLRLLRAPRHALGARRAAEAVRATSGTSAAPAPPRAISGTSAGSRYCFAASAAAAVILRAARSSSARAASVGVVRRVRASGSNAASAEAVQLSGYTPGVTSPSAFAAQVAVSANRPPAASTHAYASGSPGRGATSRARRREARRRRERRVRQPRDVRAPRADVGDPASTEQRHAPACNTDDPAVDGTDEGGLAHHAQRPELRSPAAHDRNVGARAAALDDDAVGDPQLVEHGSDSRSRSRPDRERRVVAEPLAAHGAPVAAQDEQRDIEVRLGERVFHHRGRPFDDRKDARVDRRGQRPRLQPVRAA